MTQCSYINTKGVQCVVKNAKYNVNGKDYCLKCSRRYAVTNGVPPQKGKRAVDKTEIKPRTPPVPKDQPTMDNFRDKYLEKMRGKKISPPITPNSESDRSKPGIFEKEEGTPERIEISRCESDSEDQGVTESGDGTETEDIEEMVPSDESGDESEELDEDEIMNEMKKDPESDDELSGSFAPSEDEKSSVKKKVRSYVAKGISDRSSCSISDNKKFNKVKQYEKAREKENRKKAKETSRMITGYIMHRGYDYLMHIIEDKFPNKMRGLSKNAQEHEELQKALDDVIKNYETVIDPSMFESPELRLLGFTCVLMFGTLTNNSAGPDSKPADVSKVELKIDPKFDTLQD